LPVKVALTGECSRFSGWRRSHIHSEFLLWAIY
jgi:hypothetical protein